MHLEKIGFGARKEDFTKEETIELNKIFSKRISMARAESKSDSCFFCGQKTSNLCDSHFIPRSFLENIGENGYLTGINAILGLPSMGTAVGKESPGINEAGIFNLICRKCDSSIFQDYENPMNYTVPPTQKMLAQIAMKDYLKFISKRRIEFVLTKNTSDQSTGDELFNYYFKKRHSTMERIEVRDLEDYKVNFIKAKKHYEKGTTGYYIVYYRLLDYVTPIAVQSPISLHVDLEGNIVNYSYTKNSDFIISYIHVCVFPLKEKTAVILFIDDGDTRYRKFYKQLRKLKDEEQLGVINYLIFLYCEDYFLEKNLPNRVDLSLFKQVVQLTPVACSTSPITKNSQALDIFTLSKWRDIPNLLSEQYKVR